MPLFRLHRTDQPVTLWKSAGGQTRALELLGDASVLGTTPEYRAEALNILVRRDRLVTEVSVVKRRRVSDVRVGIAERSAINGVPLTWDDVVACGV
ncbi:MAG: hypothetical protein ACJA1R_002192 [Flavobacteriales bacterium]